METKSGVVNFTGFVCAAPLLPGCDIGPAIECLSPVTLLAAEIWRDAGSFWVGDRLSPALFFGSTEGFDFSRLRRVKSCPF
jgi:hypothetical protein